MAQARRNAQVANDLRARRRRQRQRRAARNRVVSLENSQFRNVHGRNTPHAAFVHTGAEHKEAEIEEAMEDTRLYDIISEPLQRYCEAVVHPFGNEAVGATLPDRYQELIIPLTDRLELDLTPDLFNSPLAVTDWQDTPGVQLTGIFMWLQPRAIGAGTINILNTEAAGTVNFYNTNPFLCADDKFSQLAADGILNAYNLCFTGIWAASGNFPVTYGFFQGGNPNVPISPYYTAIQYSRFSNIVSNCDKIRILGAGLKLWSEEAPINTGGYSLGGWITLEDIYEALEIGDDPSDYTPVNAGALKNIQSQIKFACRSPGVKGSTVRYSSIQTAEQAEPEYPVLPSRMYSVQDQLIESIPSGLIQTVVPRPGADLGISDMTTPGSFVPCVYWSFNIKSQESEVEGVYTLKVMSMVHSEGTPTGESPFMSNKSNYDSSVQYIKQMLENPEMFPAAAAGHSFKSFMKKTRHIVSKLKKGAATAVKVLTLIDKVAKAA